MLTRTFFSRAPLAPGRYAPLPAGAVTAKGALADRLMALRAGLLSRCVSLFPETGRDCSFYGGMLTGGARIMMTGLLCLFALSILVTIVKQVYTDRQAKKAAQTNE